MHEHATDPAAGVPDDLARRLRRDGHRAGTIIEHSNQGLLLRCREGGLDVVVKTPTGRGLAWKLRQSTLLREHAAYARLEGLQGFPRCLGLIDDRWLVLEHIDGEPFRTAQLADPEEFFTRLIAVIRSMHERGVAHGDLKRKSNLLVDRAGRPVILDLGAATFLKTDGWAFNRRLFEFMCQTDLNAWVKLKYGGYASVPEPDRAHLRRSLLERILGRIRRS